MIQLYHLTTKIHLPNALIQKKLHSLHLQVYEHSGYGNKHELPLYMYIRLLKILDHLF